MQIDFHHAVTYITARSAGFTHEDANVIAYCAQYVDDATNEGVIVFQNNAMYYHICSAHKMLDYRNFESLGNHRVWLPFHFLPGNSNKKAGENVGGGFINKIVCKPDSFVAQDMLRACIEQKNKKYGLHLLGITMHIYADTWAHKGFAGVNNEINDINDLKDEQDGKSFLDKVEKYFDRAKSKVIGNALPLGHGAALSLPDLPYLKWSYTDSNGKRVQRDNTEDFTKAANMMCRAMRKYRKGDFDCQADGLPDEVSKKIRECMTKFTDDNGEDRHKKWLGAVENGEFGFTGEKVEYHNKGKGSWKYEALRTKGETDPEDAKYPYDPSFLDSHWKLFHDALQAHRFMILHDILPKYGICAA